MGLSARRLDHALGVHGVGHLQEARDVRAGLEVAFLAVFLGGVCHVVVDVDHDALELGVDLLGGPAQALGVLAHLQGGGGHAAGVGGLRGPKEHARGLQGLDAFHHGGHIRALGDAPAAVLDQGLGGLEADLILGGAGQRDVAGDGPDAGAAHVVLGVGMGVHILLDAAAAHQLDLLHAVQIDAVLVVDVAVGIAHGHDLRAQLGGLLVGEDGHVARAGDHHGPR